MLQGSVDVGGHGHRPDSLEQRRDGLVEADPPPAPAQVGFDRGRRPSFDLQAAFRTEPSSPHPGLPASLALAVQQQDRVGVVDTLHFGGLEDNLGTYFHGPQAGGGIGGKIRIARAAGEDHHAPLF